MFSLAVAVAAALVVKVQRAAHLLRRFDGTRLPDQRTMIRMRQKWRILRSRQDSSDAALTQNTCSYVVILGKSISTSICMYVCLLHIKTSVLSVGRFPISLEFVIFQATGLILRKFGQIIINDIGMIIL